MLPAAAPPRTAPPAAPRHELGADLRRLREARSLRLEDVAVHIKVVPSTLSRIETGQAPVKTKYLTVMLDLYGIDDPDERTRLAGLAKDGQPKNWWASYDNVLPAGTSRYLSLETAAAELRAYDAQAIPDLLQTRAYATAGARDQADVILLAPQPPGADHPPQPPKRGRAGASILGLDDRAQANRDEFHIVG
jgi:transcriptional regulator with XRE-family HTH domain